MPSGFGPLLSFQLDTATATATATGNGTGTGTGVAAQADAVVAGSSLILPASSFGGVESTWERRARWASETAPDGLIRLSVGVEPAGDLITDIDKALGVL
jgi:cystathionine beta-lyase/cystathionine gamma-synthase